MSETLRLLLTARKSRKGDGQAIFERQIAGPAFEAVEREGHKVIITVEDTVTGDSMPWDRKNLKAWMTDPAKMAMYDGLFVAETDRLARVDDRGWHYIEHWCYENRKRIVTGEGVHFPPRDDSDKYRWIGLKDGARRYLTSVKAKHAATRQVIQANGGIIGKPPYGYETAGPKLRKTFVPVLAEAEIVREVFTRAANGQPALRIAEWLTSIHGRTVRAKYVTDMISRETYLGHRDGVEFEPIVTLDVWNAANASMQARSIPTGGRRTVNGYSGVISCECGAPLYHHQSSRGGKPLGVAKYRCSQGRRGIAGETKCEAGALPCTVTDEAVNAYMASDASWPWVTRVTGGDAARQTEIAEVTRKLTEAAKAGDVAALGSLTASLAALQASEAEPVRVETVRLADQTVGDQWVRACLADQRTMLADRRVTVRMEDGKITVWNGIDA